MDPAFLHIKSVSALTSPMGKDYPPPFMRLAPKTDIGRQVDLAVGHIGKVGSTDRGPFAERQYFHAVAGGNPIGERYSFTARTRSNCRIACPTGLVSRHETTPVHF